MQYMKSNNNRQTDRQTAIIGGTVIKWGQISNGDFFQYLQNISCAVLLSFPQSFNTLTHRRVLLQYTCFFGGVDSAVGFIHFLC